MSVLGIALIFLQAQLATASGIVTRPGGTEPLAGATVILSPVATALPSSTRTALSQDDGRFTVRDIEPGEYRLQVQSTRYGTAAYGQRKPNGPGAVLSIAAGQRLSDLKVSMVPTGTIAGRVMGRSGEPINYASVQAMSYLYQDGKRVLSVAQTTTTDDRGEYRLFWLLPGKYIVLAAPRSSPNSPGMTAPLRPGEMSRSGELAFAQAMRDIASSALLEATNLVVRLNEDGTIREESWMPSYYPSTTELAQATTVEVAAGATVPGIDVTLGPSPVLKIRGRVTGFVTGSQATVALVARSGGMFVRTINKAASIIDGSFEFAGIAPGTYYLSAQDRSGLSTVPLEILVADRDIESLTLTLTPSIRVSARITVEGTTQGAPELFAGLVGTLQPDSGTPTGSLGPFIVPRSTQFTSGNIMVFSNVPAGGYQFNISQGVLRENGNRLHIKSVHLGREEVSNTVRISPDAGQVLLDVVLTTQTGSVGGVALGRTGDPAANATVVLVPANARRRSALYQAVVTGGDGKFRFQEIPPGDYKLFAWDDIETGAWENPDFMRVFESRGHDVRIVENKRDETSLSVIYNP